MGNKDGVNLRHLNVHLAPVDTTKWKTSFKLTTIIQLYSEKNHRDLNCYSSSLPSTWFRYALCVPEVFAHTMWMWMKRELKYWVNEWPCTTDNTHCYSMKIQLSWRSNTIYSLKYNEEFRMAERRRGASNLVRKNRSTVLSKSQERAGPKGWFKIGWIIFCA